jgi:NTP pyrophosphatase (non-canonical NTP hydrolase)
MHDFDTYQQQSWKFALDSAKSNEYLFNGLAGEVGEVCSLRAKAFRDGFPINYTERLKKELGDVLWFVSTIAKMYDIPLSEVAVANINKLAYRQQRNVIGGSGDER